MTEAQELEARIRMWRGVAVSQIPLLLVSIAFAYAVIKDGTEPIVTPCQSESSGDVMSQQQFREYQRHVEDTLSVSQEVLRKVAERSKNCLPPPQKP